VKGSIREYSMQCYESMNDYESMNIHTLANLISYSYFDIIQTDDYRYNVRFQNYTLNFSNSLKRKRILFISVDILHR